MIKAVIFDYGNVISVPQTGKVYNTMEERCGVPAKVFSDAFETYREDFDLGNINGTELYINILKKAGYNELAANNDLCAELAYEDMQSWRNINKPASDWALSLQKEGYKLGVLSNMPSDFLKYYEKEIEVFTAADVPVFSCNEKLIKPDPQIYKLIINRLNIKPNEAVFFDDLIANIQAARNEGLYAVHWENFESSKKQFEQIIAEQCQQ